MKYLTQYVGTIALNRKAFLRERGDIFLLISEYSWGCLQTSAAVNSASCYSYYLREMFIFTFRCLEMLYVDISND